MSETTREIMELLPPSISSADYAKIKCFCAIIEELEKMNKTLEEISNGFGEI